MKTHIQRRTLKVARYVRKHKATVRQTASHYGISKSTVWRDMVVNLPKLDAELTFFVHKILAINKAERTMRGGMATQKKFLAIKERPRIEMLKIRKIKSVQERKKKPLKQKSVLIAKSCLKKVRYDTSEDAYYFIKQRNGDKWKKWNCYRCIFCDGWHVTRNK